VHNIKFNEDYTSFSAISRWFLQIVIVHLRDLSVIFTHTV
jgi:hypothetical protein